MKHPRTEQQQTQATRCNHHPQETDPRSHITIQAKGKTHSHDLAVNPTMEGSPVPTEQGGAKQRTKKLKTAAVPSSIRHNTMEGRAPVKPRDANGPESTRHHIYSPATDRVDSHMVDVLQAAILHSKRGPPLPEGKPSPYTSPTGGDTWMGAPALFETVAANSRQQALDGGKQDEAAALLESLFHTYTCGGDLDDWDGEVYTTTSPARRDQTPTEKR
jgi:hypothetical protein